MKETEEHQFLRKIFGSIKINRYATAFSVISLVFAVVGMSLALRIVFSIYAQKIAEEGLDLVQQAGLSQEIYQAFIDYANQVIRQIMVYIIGFVALTAVVLNAFFNWVSHRLIIAPLKRIGNKARQISEDRSQLGDQIEPPLIEEMQMLTKVFNQMSTSLQTQMDELEERVQERTEELEAAKEKMEHMAKHDVLTGLPNRRLFDEQLKQAFRLSQRDQKPLTLLMIDLDNYKKVNDSHGHLVGDIVIKEVGERFCEALRGSDLVSRWGGDEFAVLLYGVCQPEDVEKVVEKIFSAFEEPINMNGNHFWIKMSVGAACYPDDGEEMVALLKHADAALYRAKAERERNSLRFYAGQSQS
jgi:diguanylate cyclase (GGDEF)-like protein